MNRKKSLSLSIPVEMHKEFYDVCEQYGHAKQKGMVLSAAILMFLEADPEDQGEHLKAVLEAEISAGVRAMRSRSHSTKPARKAAKKAGRSIRGITRTSKPHRSDG